MSVINPIVVQSGGGNTPYLTVKTVGWTSAGSFNILVKDGYGAVLMVVDGEYDFRAEIYFSFTNIYGYGIKVNDGRGGGTPTYYGKVLFNGTLKGSFTSSVSEITIPYSDFLSAGNVLEIEPSNNSPV